LQWRHCREAIAGKILAGKILAGKILAGKVWPERFGRKDLEE
jgi:hypothetical protein